LLDGHPGQAYGCRCVAEPVKPRLSQEEHERLRLVDPPIESVYPELLFIGIGRAAWVTAKAAARGIRATTANVGERIVRYQTERLFRRPRGVPKNWVRESSRKGEGVRYRDPKNVHNEVRIQKGNPQSIYPNSTKTYVRWKKDGKWLDKRGNISNNKEETHIPMNDFKFKLELFK
jgi:hypothetical protein